MCGIAGFYLLGGRADNSAERLDRMCAAIQHRGPDDQGTLISGGCGIGMRRLSIIDVAGGHQPISNEDGTLWIVFNGEVYNFGELTEYLKGRGHTFQTHSDTETLLHLYEEEGVKGLERLRGMFAFAILDQKRGELLLVRDRFGKKPLYYTRQPSGLYFASEIKSLRAAGVPLDPNREALQWYLLLNYIPEPQTAFVNVEKLAPGGWMKFRADGSSESGRYWHLPSPASAPEPANEEDLCARIEKTFDEAVRLRMTADVPLGAFLSGGIDSSLVVASMARQSSEPVKTFSIGFSEQHANELPWARMVADQYKTDHHEVVLSPDVTNLTSRVVWLLDEPLGDTAVIPMLLVSEVARQHVKVALSGDGGDELFGGYTSFRSMGELAWADRVPSAVRQLTAGIASALPYSARGKNYLWMLSRPSAVERYLQFNYAPEAMRRRLLASDWLIDCSEAHLRDRLPEYWLPRGADPIAMAMHFETSSNLTGGMLVKSDRMSMGASLEVRCPLLDHKLAELAIPLAHHWKLRDGRGKYILLKALGRRLPAAILERPKMGFAFPLDTWFRGPLRPMLRDHLTSKTFYERGIVSPPFLQQMLDEHDSGRRDNSSWLWSLLVLELWFGQVTSAQPADVFCGAPAV